MAIAVMAAGIFVGAMVPGLTGALEPYALKALFLVIVFSLLPFARMPARELFVFDQSVIRIVAWQLLLLPALVISLGVLANLPDYITAMMIVTACSGALFASPAIASLLKLDTRQALHCMILSTAVMPVSLFVFLSAFHTESVVLDLVTYAKRAAIYLIVPFGVMVAVRPIIRRLQGATLARLEVGSRWAMVMALLVFGIGIMHAVSEEVMTNPAKVIFYFALTTSLAAGMMMATTIVMYRRGMTEAMTAGIVSGFRNIGLGFALVGDMFGPELSVYVGISMIPVFVAPFAIRVLTSRTTEPVLI